MRYADDYVCCFQYKREAEIFFHVLKRRLDKFGLELAEDKSKILRFGRFAAVNRKRLGKFHIVAEIWTVNSKNEILLTLRHPDKDIYPNLWENTGGSVLAGETSRLGAVRELFEETGINIKEDELVLLGTRKEVTAFVDTYIVRKDISISDLTMQEGETVEAKWVNIGKLDEMIDNGDIALPVAERLEQLRIKFENYLFGC